MYKQALALGLRYPYHGACTTEDLFDLGTTELNGVYMALKSRGREGQESLLEKPTLEGEELSIKLAIVQDIFETRQAEAEARKSEAERAMRKQKILGIIAGKQDEALAGKSVEELEALIEGL